jgi:rubrerythrin
VSPEPKEAPSRPHRKTKATKTLYVITRSQPKIPSTGRTQNTAKHTVPKKMPYTRGISLRHTEKKLPTASMNPKFINNLTTRRHFHEKGRTALNKSNDPKTLANFIKCLSVLEDETSKLYSSLSAKVAHPLIKSLLASIAEDSIKHGTLLRGVADSIMLTPKPSNCEKNTGEIYRIVTNLKREVDAKKTFAEEDMAELSQKLSYLESVMGEEYYMFVQLKTLDIMMKEINEIYRIDLGSLKNIFTRIINDEDHHREIIATIKSTIEQKQTVDLNPLVRYTNPDHWLSPFSPANTP